MIKLTRSPSLGVLAALVWFLGWCLIGPATSQGASPAPKEAKSLADELPRIPPVEPEKALATFQLQQGFQLELVAAEPQVASPVDACFDENGHMYVAEMRDYPFSWEPTALNPKGGGKKDAGTVRLLEDTDGDGRIDRSVIFADKITWPTSVCCYRGGVFVLAPPHLHYFKDTNGDGVADVREIVLTGFRRDNVQAITNNLKWCLDNRIVFAAGRNGGKLIRNGKTVFAIRGQDISFDPATLDFSALTGGEQFGLSFDDWGTRFVCSNSNHIEQVVLEDRYSRRNPYYAVSGAIQTIAKEGPAAPVFRRSPPEPWRVVRTRRRVSDPATLRTLPHTEQFAIGYFTSAAGVTIYRGNAYPPAYRGNAFIGDVGGNLIHRKNLLRDGVRIIAERADADVEFVASTDNWFRPVNFVNAPDGTLYLLDMYRETIEHPFSIPDDIKAHLDLQSGDDRGRIYRLVSPGFAKNRVTPLGKFSSNELVPQLESANAWNRDTAQRLLWERQDKSAVPALERLTESSRTPLGRLHALHTLDGLHSLSDDVLLKVLHDADPRVRAHAIQLSEPRLRTSGDLLAAVSQMTDDPDSLVRYQLALSLGEADGEKVVDPLARLARSASTDPLLRSALMTSVARDADKVLLKLLADKEFLTLPGAAPVLSDLATIVGAQPNRAGSIRLLKTAFADEADLSRQLTVLGALGRGLARQGLSISTLIARQPVDASLQESARALFKRAAATTWDGSRTETDRVAAVGMLAFAPYEQASPALLGLLTPRSSERLQLAAVGALASQARRDVAKQLLAGWKSFGPNVRRAVIDAMTLSSPRLQELFEAMESHQVAPGEIDRDVKQVLINHRDVRIRDRARKLLAAELPQDRAKVVAAYQPALTRNGDANRGRAVYEKRCSACHRVGDQGHAVGPDLVSVQNKAPGDLLLAILDPSRETQPNYIAYTLVTNQGTIHTGIIASESTSAVTLRRAEGKEDAIFRTQIEELASTGKSLMPEGFEKEIDALQLADLIAFIKGIRTAPAR